VLVGATLCLVNLRFIPSAGWPNAKLCLKCSYDAESRRNFIAELAPHRVRVTLVTPGADFVSRPQVIGESFARGQKGGANETEEALTNGFFETTRSRAAQHKKSSCRGQKETHGRASTAQDQDGLGQTRCQSRPEKASPSLGSSNR